MKVFKYVMEITDYVDLDMPSGAEVLTAQMQNGDLCLWAKVDENAPKEKRRFRIAGTGHPLEGKHEYISTVFPYNDSLVFHIFEEVE